MKHIVAALSAVAVVAASAAPVAAFSFGGVFGNRANVSNTVTTSANTGSNAQSNGMGGSYSGGKVNGSETHQYNEQASGDVTVETVIYTDANNSTDGSVRYNKAKVTNAVSTTGTTGGNTQTNKLYKGGKVWFKDGDLTHQINKQTTGKVNAKTHLFTVVNSTYMTME